MVKKLLTYGFGESAAKGINWLILTTLPLLVASSAEYGLVGLMVAAEGLGVGILMIGQDRSVLRFYYHEEDPAGFLSSVYALSLMVLAPVLICVLALSVYKDTIAGIPLYPHLVLLVGAVLFLNLTRIYLSVLRVEEAARSFVILRISFALLKCILILAVVHWLQGGLAYVVGLFAASGVMFLATLPDLRKRLSRRVRLDALKKLWAFGWPFIFHVASGRILMFADRFMLEYYVDLSAVGSYTLAYSLGSAVAFIFGALAIYFEPLIYRKAEDQPAAEKLMGYYSLMGILLSAGWGIAMLVALPYFVDHVVGAEYASITQVTPIVLAAHVIIPIYHQANYRLTLHQRTKILASGTLVAALSNIVLNFFWIPPFGERGAAYATFASLLLLCLIVFVSSVQSTGLGWKNVNSLYPMIFTLGCTTTLVAVSDSRFSFIAFTLLSIVAAVSLAIASPRIRLYWQSNT